MMRTAALLGLLLAGCATAPTPRTIVAPPIAAQVEPSAPVAPRARASEAPSSPNDEGSRPASDLFEAGPKCYRACIYLCHDDDAACARSCSIECSEF